jgi:hypothetical protein
MSWTDFEIWDTEIPVKLVKNLNSPQTFPHWTDELQSRIHTGTPSFLSAPKQWISCIDPTKIGDCAIKWAEESNAFTCTYVYAHDLTVDLGGSYFTGAVPIVETQVAKGINPPTDVSPFFLPALELFPLLLFRGSLGGLTEREGLCVFFKRTG